MGVFTDLMTLGNNWIDDDDDLIADRRFFHTPGSLFKTNIGDWVISPSYPTTLYPSITEDKETGDYIETVQCDIPGCGPEDVKASWDTETKTLTLTAGSAHRSYTHVISSFSGALMEDTLSVEVKNGIATVSIRAKNTKKEEEERKKNRVREIPIK